MAGMLASAALRPYVDEITLIETDELPSSPQPRRGLPQAAHNHMLLGGGAEAIEQLLPGTIDQLYAAGAHRRSYLDSILIRTAWAWSRRLQVDAYVIACSRDLIDHVIRRQLLGDPKIKVIESATVIGLAGGATRVTGAHVERAGEQPEIVEADLVIDATGHRSKAAQWLTQLGVGSAPEEHLDPGFAYSRRLYEAPPGFRDGFPGVLIQPQHGTGRPGIGAALMPNENGRWMVVMIGTRGAPPPTNEQDFLAFARDERTRLVADLISRARPLSPVRAYRDLVNRRYRFDKLPMPEGFVAVGDAAVRVNPTYATGMSMVARSALMLRQQASRGVGRPGFSRLAQGDVMKAGQGPWQLAVSIDQWYPDVRTNIRRQGGHGILRFTNRYTVTSTENQKVANAVYRVAAQMADPRTVMRLPLLLAVIRGPRQGPLTGDQSIRQYPPFAQVLDQPPLTLLQDAPDSPRRWTSPVTPR